MSQDAEFIPLWLQLSGREIDCSECGRDDVPSDESTTERIVFEDGTAAHRPLCLPCARRLGIDN